MKFLYFTKKEFYLNLRLAEDKLADCICNCKWLPTILCLGSGAVPFPFCISNSVAPDENQMTKNMCRRIDGLVDLCGLKVSVKTDEIALWFDLFWRR